MDTPWMAIAAAELGVHETPGPASTARIVAYHAATDGVPGPDEVPWCSSFACWVMEQAGVPSPRSKAARAWLAWGRALTEPVVGCVVVFQRGTLSWQGHVGFVVGIFPDHLAVLGGNQHDAVTVEAFPRSHALGYRLPAAA